MVLCKNEECSNGFKPKHKRHYFCCEVCKYNYHNKTDKHLGGMRQFNKSAKGKARTKRFLDSEKGKKYNREKSAKYRKRNPEKIIAVTLANRYLPDKPCSVNGCDEAGEKHHEDYSKPLEVLYFCEEHHTELHYEKLVGNK